MKPVDVVIPVAGIGRRFRSNKPKCLLKLANEDTLIGRQVRIILDCVPVRRILVASGFGSDSIPSHLPMKSRTFLNPDFETTNVARSVGMALEQSDLPCLVIYGDIFFCHRFLSQLEFNEDRSFLVLDKLNQDRTKEVGATVVSGHVTRMSFGLENKWAHTMLLSGEEKRLFVDLSRSKSRSKYFGFEIINEIIDMGGRFQAVENEDPWFAEVDSYRDATRINQWLAK